MRALKSFARLWYDFIVGDDWTVAVGVVAAMIATAVLTHARVNAWWLVPSAALLLLAASLAKAASLARAAGRRPPGR
jgi:hypothetical protein